MKFTHYSKNPLGRFVVPQTLGTGVKPAGVLWLARDDTWKQQMIDGIGVTTWNESYRVQTTCSIAMDTIFIIDTPKLRADVTRTFSPDGYGIDWDVLRRETGVCGVYVKKGHESYAWVDAWDSDCLALWDPSCIRSATNFTTSSIRD